MQKNTKTDTTYRSQPSSREAEKVQHSQLRCHAVAWGVDCTERVTMTNGNVYSCPPYWVNNGNDNLKGCSLLHRGSQQDQK